MGLSNFLGRETPARLAAAGNQIVDSANDARWLCTLDCDGVGILSGVNY